MSGPAMPISDPNSRPRPDEPGEGDASADPAAEGPAAGGEPGDLRPGDMVGKHRIVAPLGRGGMGVVYEAEDTLLGRRVAVKVLPPAEPDDPLGAGPDGMVGDLARAEAEKAARRFLLEARSAGRLNHPNAVTVHEVDRTPDGRLYIVMELVRGGTAADRVRSAGPLPWAEATRIIADACRGLAAAHAVGLIHRDIKPANILLVEDGPAKLADFGLAKDLGRPRGDSWSTVGTGAAGAAAGPGGPPGTTGTVGSGGPVGTPEYMSPEQCRGDRLDHRTDVYSLGATYFALLAGRSPYHGLAGPVQIMFAHAHGAGPPPDPRDRVAGVPAGCAAVVRRAMERKPDDRYRNAAEMLADLDALLDVAEAAAAAGAGVGVGAGVAPRGYGTGLFARRRSGTGPLPLPLSPPGLFDVDAETVGSLADTVPGGLPGAAPPGRGPAVLIAALSAVAVLAAGLSAAMMWPGRTGPVPPNTGGPAATTASPHSTGTAAAGTSAHPNGGDPVSEMYRLLLSEAGTAADLPNFRRRAAVAKRLRLFGEAHGQSENPAHREAAEEAARAADRVEPRAVLRTRWLFGNGAPTTIRFFADGRRVAVAWPWEPAVRILEIAADAAWGEPSARQAALLIKHNAFIEEAAPSPDGMLLATAGRDGIALWDATESPAPDDGSRERLLQWLPGPYTTAAVWAGGGRVLITAHPKDGTVRLWDVVRPATGKTGPDAVKGATLRPRAVPWTGFEGPPHSLALSPDGKTLAVGTGDWSDPGLPHPEGELCLRRFPDGTTAWSARPTGSLWSLAFLSEGRLVSAASLDGTVRAWRTDLGAETKPAVRAGAEFLSAGASPDGRLLAVAGFGDAGCRLLSAEPWAEVLSLKGAEGDGRHFSASISRDGRLLAVGCHNGAVQVWDISSFRLGPAASVSPPDGR